MNIQITFMRTRTLVNLVQVNYYCNFSAGKPHGHRTFPFSDGKMLFIWTVSSSVVIQKLSPAKQQTHQHTSVPALIF